jgi:hypothetical protein
MPLKTPSSRSNHGGWLVVLALSAMALGAGMPMTVAQLTDFIRSSVVDLKTPDQQIAQYLHTVKLTEHLDGDRLRALEAIGAGPRTRHELEALSTASKGLPAPPPMVEKPKPVELPPEPSPDSIKQKRVINNARDYALTYTKQLPNFICLQLTRRYYDPNGGEDWAFLDRISTKLTYFEQQENYEVINLTGTGKSVDYWSLGGTLSAGEFGSLLKGIFDPASGATFDWGKWGQVRGHTCYVFRYDIDQAHSRYHVAYEKKDDIIPAYRGVVYIDRDTEMVLRATLTPILPVGFPVKQASIDLHYDFADIGGSQYLLPLKVLVLSRVGRITTKNEVEFRLYQKYGTNVTLKFDTENPPPPLPDDATKDTKQPK